MLHDLGPKVRGRGPEPGESRTFECRIEIVRLSSKLHWDEFEVDRIFDYNRSKVDITLVPEAVRAGVYRQQFERFLRAFDRSANLRYTTNILLRLMIRARAIDSISLPPALLQLFVYRYHRDLCQQSLGVYSGETLDHFNLARYVCFRLSEFDYRNRVWCVDGNIVSEGHSLRVLLPTYPEYDLTQNFTAEKTGELCIALGKAACVETLEEFVGATDG